MRILILGGTAWFGGTLAALAVRRGDEVTCLARGASGPPPEGVEFVTADRDGDDAYRQVRDRPWDAVFDVAREPGQVRRAVAALAPVASRFVFVSTANVYADNDVVGADESAPLYAPLEALPETDGMPDPQSYGAAKVACERHVVQAFGAGRSLLARAGLIGGPGDTTDRIGYWPLRFSRPAAADGSVLVPHSPDLMSQVIDVRDLAGWLLAAAERGVSGVFNAMGESIPLADHLAVARRVAGHSGPMVPADPQWLVEHGVAPWMGECSLPLWLPLPEYAGFTTRDTSAARSAGLSPRPLEQTLADTLAWELTRPPGRRRSAGLSDDDERRLLSLLAAGA